MTLAPPGDRGDPSRFSIPDSRYSFFIHSL